MKENLDSIAYEVIQLSDVDLCDALDQLEENLLFLESGTAKIISLVAYRQIKILVSILRFETQRRALNGRSLPQKTEEHALLFLSGRKKSGGSGQAR